MIDPKSAPAHWHSGYVQEAGRWIKYDASADVDGYRKLLDRYETERAAKPDTLVGHWTLASWCGDHGLPMQERAHLYKVLDFDADHEGARARLGFVRVGGAWIARSEIEETRLRKIETERAFKKWAGQLRPIRAAFESGDPARMAAAKAKLATIRDPAAIPAMEALLSRLNLDAATAVVFVIRQMKGPDAAVGLARQAVFAEWYPVGKEAAEALRDHDELSYVPLLLSGLSTPPVGRSHFSVRSDTWAGKLLVRYEFERERRDRTEKVVYDVSYGVWTFSNATGVTVPLSQARAQAARLGWGLPVVQAAHSDYYSGVLAARAEERHHVIAGMVEEETRAVKELNSKICRALRTATNSPEMEHDDPRAWWAWWNKRREVFVAALKPVVTQYVAEERAEFVRRYSKPGEEIPMMSCLVAGTKVWTDVGLRPIETIQLGDRVLAQDVKTGELAYRAVLRPTERPAAPTVVLTFGKHTIRATGGHPFWAVGKGWIKARDFQPGMRMATADGTVEVTKVEPAPNAKAHNLIVDGFSTYFVEEVLVLSHDTTEPTAARGDLPGQTNR